MTPRKGLAVALTGLVIAVPCTILAFLMPNAEGGGVSNIVMISFLGAGIGFIFMVAGLAVAARTGLHVALLGLVIMLLCSALIFLLILFFDTAWLGTGIPPIVALLIVALSIGGGNLGFIVMVVGLVMAGVEALRNQRGVPSDRQMASQAKAGGK